MYFTREPQVEAVITAKESHQLILQCQLGEEVAEYRLHAVEIVSFGRVHCFRNSEDGVSFLLPMHQCTLFEVVHVKLTTKSLLLPPRGKVESHKDRKMSSSEKQKHGHEERETQRRRHRSSPRRSEEKEETSPSIKKASKKPLSQSEEGKKAPTAEHISTEQHDTLQSHRSESETSSVKRPIRKRTTRPSTSSSREKKPVSTKSTPKSTTEKK